MKAAVRDNAQIYLKGIAKHHTGVHDTIRELQMIGGDLDVKPDVRFKPKYFERFNIEKVPTILYQKDDVTVSAEGIVNLGWLKNKHESATEDTFFGNYGNVTAVVEESLLDTIRKRMEAYDWEGKKEKAIKGYWKKQEFNALPPATKDDVWYIDPTVRVQKDITNGNGDLLAKAGDVKNAIASTGMPLTLYIFDPTNIAQLQWAHTLVNNDVNNGQVMVMFSKLDKSRGWKHLDYLRKHFSRELYQLPRELIRKFDLTGLPVKVSTDLSRNVLKVEQFNVEEER
jgi:conjugal transfer pilus assembly protein TraW